MRSARPFSGKYSLEGCVAKDIAELLYKHGVGGIVVSTVASLVLAFIAAGQPSHLRFVWLWWGCMAAALLCRTIDLVHWRLTRSAKGTSKHRGIFRFACCLMASAVLWGVFPIAFFGSLNEIGRASTAVVLSAMVGGGITVFAPSKPLAIAYCALLLLPASIRFLLLPGIENALLGVLGWVFFLVMAASARITHRAMISAVRLSRANESLVAQMEKERGRAESANDELRAAQMELSKTNLSLATRVAARTADLAKEIVDKEGLAKELAHLASTDSLTGLWNRARVVERLTGTLGRAATTGQCVAILFIDLDKFKGVNDVMGHFAGDQVLKAIALRLSENLPNVELARWGGDEFVVAASGVNGAEEAFQLAGRLRQRICSPIEINSRMVAIDATIGIALFPQHGHTSDALIRAADVAMYASKEDRRSKIRLFEASIGQRLAERHLLEQALRKAIESHALSLVFQPIVSASGGHCDAVEALLRWNDPVRGTILPGAFISIAEETGEILVIGRWVLEESCREALTWPGDQPPAVAVNVSAAQIRSSTFVAEVLAILAATGLRPQRLYLEITESLFAGDYANITPVLRELRQHGIRISLDDFGTGFSCLANLHNLLIDQIKIDKSFVNAIADGSAPLVRAILTTAQTLGVDVVAEGVETAAQALQLTQMGSPHLQGFFFSSVLPPKEMRQWLAAEELTLNEAANAVSA